MIKVFERIIGLVDFAEFPSSEISKMRIAEPIRVPDPHQVDIGHAELRRGSAGFQSKNAVMIIATIIGVAQRLRSPTCLRNEDLSYHGCTAQLPEGHDEDGRSVTDFCPVPGNRLFLPPADSPLNRSSKLG